MKGVKKTFFSVRIQAFSGRVGKKEKKKKKKIPAMARRLLPKKRNKTEAKVEKDSVRVPVGRKSERRNRTAPGGKKIFVPHGKGARDKSGKSIGELLRKTQSISPRSETRQGGGLVCA